jgi:hypothetical protein
LIRAGGQGLAVRHDRLRDAGGAQSGRAG